MSNNSEKEPLLKREIRDDFVGTNSYSSNDYETYIKPNDVIQVETGVYW